MDPPFKEKIMNKEKQIIILPFLAKWLEMSYPIRSLKGFCTPFVSEILVWSPPTYFTGSECARHFESTVQIICLYRPLVCCVRVWLESVSLLRMWVNVVLHYWHGTLVFDSFVSHKKDEPIPVGYNSFNLIYYILSPSVFDNYLVSFLECSLSLFSKYQSLAVSLQTKRCTIGIQWLRCNKWKGILWLTDFHSRLQRFKSCFCCFTLFPFHASRDLSF